MGRRVSTQSSASLVEKYINTAYDTVKVVADNIDDIHTISDSLAAIEPVAENLDIILDAHNQATAAKSSADSASVSEANSKVSETNAKSSETNAQISRTQAEVSATNASNSAALAESSKTSAEAASANALTYSNSAKAAELAAKDSASEANLAKLAAELSESNTAVSETNASTSEVNSKVSETNAKTAETNAGIARTGAESAETNAGAFAITAGVSASISTDSATESTASATRSEASAVAAGLAKDAAIIAETNAETAEANARSQANAALSSANAADVSRGLAQTASAGAVAAQVGAEESEELSKEWANNPHGTLITGEAEYSSKHYATDSKAEADRAKALIDSLDTVPTFIGTWLPSSGSYPADPAVGLGYTPFYIVSESVTAFGINFLAGGKILWNAVTVVWDYVPPVTTGVDSINGLIGAVTLTAVELGFNNAGTDLVANTIHDALVELDAKSNKISVVVVFSDYTIPTATLSDNDYVVLLASGGNFSITIPDYATDLNTAIEVIPDTALTAPITIAAAGAASINYGTITLPPGDLGYVRLTLRGVGPTSKAWVIQSGRCTGSLGLPFYASATAFDNTGSGTAYTEVQQVLDALYTSREINALDANTVGGLAPSAFVPSDDPSDGSEYVRKDGAWAVTEALYDAAVDGKEYIRKNGAWSEVTHPTIPVDSVNGYTGVVSLTASDVGATEEATIDGKQYGRTNGAWTEVVHPVAPVESVNGQTGIVNLTPVDIGAPTEAPNDGIPYIRRDSGWEAGVLEAPKDGNTYLRKDGIWHQVVINPVVKRVNVFTNIQGDTVLNVPVDSADHLFIFYEGLKLATSDYTADTVNNTITLAQPVTEANDTIEVLEYNNAALSLIP